MNKANFWSSRADVLNDLKEVTGGNPGVSDLDKYVAVGTRPPPDRQESIDEDEFQYRFGVHANGPEGSTAPDLDGISQMLQLVNEDPFIDNEPKTVFRNTMTDEIRISKLNPNVTEFVPSSVRRPKPQKKKESPKKSKFKPPKKLDHNNQRSSKMDDEVKVSSENKISDIEKKDVEKTNTPSDLLIGEKNNLTVNEFRGKHSASNSINSEIKVSYENKTCDIERKDEETSNTRSDLLIGESNNSTIYDFKLKPEVRGKHSASNSINSEIEVSCENKTCDIERKDEKTSNTRSDLLIGESNNSTIYDFKLKPKCSASNSMNSISKATISSNDISLDKKVDLTKMKSEEIEEIKMKIKSKIIETPGDSIQHKKEKNVAIAALLRLYATAPEVLAEKPIKLITPDYFKALPNGKPEAKKESDIIELNDTVEELEEPATSNTRNPMVYKDPFVEESIAKVNNWFDNEDSPKPKQLPEQPPVALAPPVPLPPVPLPPAQLKEVLSFKKKNASSLTINSPKSETSKTSSEKKKKFTTFVPSTHANDLLQKYEKNAKTQVAPKEDWRDALERQLMEKDKEIRKKIRDEQDGTSPNSSGGN